jgi:uncharacterized protein YndB with AHSA1/START domain
MTHHTHTTGAITISTLSDLEIVSERVLDAPRESVFAAFTDPGLISEWWGRRGTTTIVDKMDLKPGGAWRFVTQTSNGEETAFRGAFREIAPPERIGWTFEWEGMPGHVLVETVTFEDLGERTKVKTNSLYDNREDRDGMLNSGMEEGMNESYERLEELLARLGSH